MSFLFCTARRCTVVHRFFVPACDKGTTLAYKFKFVCVEYFDIKLGLSMVISSINYEQFDPIRQE
jgi:hypothetical protein